MTDAPESVPAHTMFKVLAALGELGEATATAVAEHAGLGYSTATAKLRAWEQTGQAERFRTDDNRTMWRLTDTGRTTTATTHSTPPSREAPADATPRGAAAAAPHTAALTDPLDTAATPERDGEHPAPTDGHAADEPPASASDAPAPSGTATSSGRDDEQPPSGESDHDGQQPDPVPDDDAERGAESDADPEDEAASMGHSRRAKGSLRGTVLDILEAHPDRAYKTSELCKLVDAANAGTGAAKASAGAVANAATKLVASGQAVQTLERPATYQLAPATGSR
ncbi:MarR family winged helix-turn-helix transcriptional regulator [Micromonospora sp. 4G55]|uniref:MarR family winged helix-turn-helix transcriptional regulator n=1 Tax=Micromonospora sp. 4G55 TaxID=2806102 RepID=UPI001A62A5F1|nr:MarR family winged helix-turn-helix transcriptional regulator [Micromonospora sp. 4G55]MBM0255850.1 MarR family transcriptional regulator [Micromonospora sp. 4G55]